MSQGIREALDFLQGQVEAIPPKTDAHHGFVCAATGNGLSLALEEMNGNNRYFEMVVSAFPIDDGQAGLSGRKRATVDLRVRYDIPRDQAFMMRMIAEDTADLIDKLKGPNYDLVTTGIVSLITSPPIFEPILDPQGERVAFVLTLPFDLLYLES